MPSRDWHWSFVALGAAVLVGGATVRYSGVLHGNGVFHPLTLRITGVKSGEGVLRVTICTEAERFPEECALATALQAKAGVSIVRLPKVEEGAYAAAVFHDENKDGRLDMFDGRMVPSEGVAFSNDAFGGSGVPLFDQAEFKFDGKEQRLRMRYMR
jgi:uncharacterized protein (DUF2141 family)